MKRYVIFAAIGPFLGGFWLLLTTTMMSGYLHGASWTEIGKLFAVFFKSLQYSYLFGILPALMFGAIDDILFHVKRLAPALRVLLVGCLGFAAAELTGEENADEMRAGNEGVRFLSNHAGGILGGISTGQPVVARFAVKPTSSILSPRQTIDRNGAETDIMTKGRHDPCVGIRAVPVGEAMMACVLADHFLRHRGQIGR